MGIKFETPYDLEREYIFAKYIESKFDCILYKLDASYSIDFGCIKNNKLVCWVELKRRKNSSKAYPTYMLNNYKLCRGLSLSEHTQIPFILAVEFTDSRLWVNCNEVSKTNPALRFMSKRKKRVEDDAEPMTLIPMKYFKSFKHPMYCL